MLRTYYLKADTFIKKNRLQALVDVALFAAITIIFHELWWTYAEWIKSFQSVNESADWLAKQVFNASYWINTHLLGLSVKVTEPNTMWFANTGYVGVTESCSGLKQFYQVAVLFIIFPGPWKHKLWYIPMGFVVMFITNVFRIVVLSLIVLWIPQHWNFVHDWILRPFFYIIIFILWVIWVEKFRRVSNGSSQS